MQPANDTPSIALLTSGFELLAAVSLLEATSDAVYLVDLNRRVLCWNHAAEALYGWARPEALGQHVDLLLYDAGSTQFEEAFFAVRSSRAWAGEQQHMTNQGQEVTVQSRWTLIEDDQGNELVLVVNTDITAQKAHASQVLRRQRLESLGTMASGIAHDMNNILGPLLILIDTLAPQIQEEQSRQLLALCKSSTHRGITLMEQMVAFASGAAGAVTLVDIPGLIGEIEQLLRSTLPSDTQLSVALDPETWSVSGDMMQLHQVAMNLCVNARDALQTGGQIRIRVRNVDLSEADAVDFAQANPGRYVLISVADNGAGIPEDTLEKMFEPFFTTKETGTGLGLSTVLGIITGHQGFVDVDSTAGLGTTFKVYLPAASETLNGNVSRILVVDDDTFFRQALVMLLIELGFETLEANNAASGQQLVETASPDLVLCDLRLGNQTGDVFLQSLKDHPQTSHLPVVLMTGNLPAALLLDFKPDYYLHKPFGVTEVVEMLDVVIFS